MSTLPVPSRRTAVLVAVVSASVVLVLGLAIDAGWVPLVDLDRAVDDAVRGWALATPWAVSWSQVLDKVGGLSVSMLVTTVTVLVLLAFRRWRLALGVVGVATLAPLVTDWIKVVVERARPVWEQPLGNEGTFSYPSGHATGGLAVYAVCGIALATLLHDRRWAWALAVVSTLFGLSIGVSRVVLGVHWPSDVVGGWCVAISVAAVFLALLLPLDPPPAPVTATTPADPGAA